MRMFASVGVFVILAGFAGSALAGEAQQKKKKNAKGLTGSVVSVKKENDKTTLTVKTKGKKGAEGKEETVTLGKDTKIEKVSGKKGQQQTSAATVSDLTTGANVTVFRNKDNQVDRVAIAGKKKKNT